jgi:4-amino-4-deoxy-L-arabinose transferase-like glycosyltransferase/Flp pilus assembly protein TadD
VALGIALTVVFAVKLAVLLQLRDHPLLQPSAAGGLDSQYYLQLAQRVAGGDLLLAPGLYFVSPLYIYFLAALLTLGGGSLFFVKIVQIALGTAACGLLWVAAREWFSHRAGWIAVALAGLTGVFTFYETLILQAALDPFLAALSAAVLTLALRRRQWGWPVAAGLTLGVHAMNRPNTLVVAAGLFCVMLVRADTRRRALAMAAGLSIALLPISLRNAVAAGTFSPTPSHGGLNFYIGNNPEADGTYHSIPGITPNIAGQAEDARRVAEGAEGRALRDGEVSSYFTRRALDWWRDDPATASRLFLRKLAFTLNSAWLTLNYSYPFYQDEFPLLRALFVGPLLLIPLGFLGLWAHSIDGRAVAGRFWIWAAVVPLTLLSIAIFFVASRYRIPLLVPLCVTAAACIDALARASAGRHLGRVAIAVGCAIPVVMLAGWDFGLDDGRRAEQTQMALAMIDQKRWDDADRWAARAGTDHPNPAAFHLQVGQAFAQASRPAEAIRHLEVARQFGVRSVGSAYDLAVAYGQDGRSDMAAHVLMSVEPADVRDASMRDRFSDALTQAGLDLVAEGKLEEAVAAFQRATRLSPDRPSAHLNLAVAYAQSGQRSEAREEALRALALDSSYQRAKQFLATLDRP